MGVCVTKGLKVEGAEALCKLISKKEVHYSLAPGQAFTFFTTSECFLIFPPVSLSALFRNVASAAS